MQNINIIGTLYCHSGDDRYVRAFAAMYASLRTHTLHKLSIYIVHDETLTDQNIRILREYIEKNDSAYFINVDHFPAVAAIGREFGCPIYSPAVIWRPYLADLCPVHKAIVLDADLIFLCDINELWKTNLDGCAISASLRGKPWPAEYHRLVETTPEKYFRAGVSVMNLEHIRNDARFMENRLRFIREDLPELGKIAHLPDQSLLNYFFSDRCIPMDINLCSAARIGATQQDIAAWLQRIRSMHNVIIDVKGWLNQSPFANFYWTYLLLTPWCTEAYEFLAQQQRR